MRTPPLPTDGRHPTSWLKPATAAEFTGVPLARVMELVDTGRVRVRGERRGSRVHRPQVNIHDVVAAAEQDLADDGLWLDPADAAARVGINRARVSAWINERRVRCCRGPGGMRVCLGDCRRLVQTKGTR